MKKEYMLIGGYNFQVFHKSLLDWNIYNCYHDLYNCYQHPSIYKHNIYYFWSDFVCRISDDYPIKYVYSYGVKTYNCMQFTFGADIDIYYNDWERKARIYITKTRQELTIYDL